MTTYQGTFDKVIPGLRFIDRSAEGILETVYDNCYDPVPPRLYDCGPYVESITKDGQPFAVVHITNHFYESGWWYELTSVSIIHTPAELIAKGYVPPIGPSILPVTLPAAGSEHFPGPMKITPGVEGYEAMTGGRGGIGIVRDATAQWFLTNDARNMIECAKSGATQPIWNYDNGKLIDLVAKPKTTHYPGDNQGGAPFWLGPFPPVPTDPNTVLQPSTPDTAHMEELGGILALATGEPRYLRWLQARVIRGFDEDAYWMLQPGWGVVTIWKRQARGIAWLARELFYCYWATVEAEKSGNLPADCLPSSHFKTIIDNQVTLFHQHIEPSPMFASLAIPALQGDDLNGFWVAWWQCDMVNQVFALYAQHWPEWVPIYLKTLRNLAARVNLDGKKQWPTAMPTWYWGVVTRMVNGVQTYWEDYPTLWREWSKIEAAGGPWVNPDFNWLTPAQVATLNADPTNGGKFIKPTEYESWTFGAIAFAVYLDRGPLKGVVSAEYPNLEQGFADYSAMMLNGYHDFIPQCSFSVTPLSIVPPPENPPPGAVHMGKPVSVQVGQHVSVPFTYDDGSTPPLPSLPPVAVSAKSVPPGLVNATVTVNANGTGSIDVVGLVKSAEGATLELDVQGAQDSVALTVSVPLPPCKAVHLNP